MKVAVDGTPVKSSILVFHISTNHLSAVAVNQITASHLGTELTVGIVSHPMLVRRLWSAVNFGFNGLPGYPQINRLLLLLLKRSRRIFRSVLIEAGAI